MKALADPCLVAPDDGSDPNLERFAQIGARDVPFVAPLHLARPGDARVTNLCYTFSMKAKKPRRAGATETFSVSVDTETKRALRALADAEFGGNLSALVTDFAEDARRRLAAGAYLQKHRVPKLAAGEADQLQAEIDREVLSARKRRKRSAAA